MKRKLVFIFCGIFIVTAIVAMLIFIFSGKSGVSAEKVNMEGTWKVATYIKDGSTTLVNNEYMVFDAESVSNYRDGLIYVTSRYLIDDNLLMQLTDISRKYSIEKYTENYVRLYEDQSVYMDLIRYPNAEMLEIIVDTSVLSGRWNVIYRPTDQIIVDEYLEFENGVMSNYRNGELEPVLTTDYSWQQGNHLIADSLEKDMILNIVSDDTVILIETDTGFILELQKAN